MQTKAVAYIRVSTEEQGARAGLEAQRRAITQEAERRGWRLLEIHQDTASGKSLEGRTGLQRALTALHTCQADVLVVAKLDRLSRSLLDFAALMDRSRRENWAIVALDLGVDTTTPSGEMMANVLAVFAHFERRLIGQRTREALAVKKTQPGVHLGRPRLLPQNVRRRIRLLREGGMTLAAIAETLNAEEVATAQGGRRWYPSTVRAVLAANV
jgi:DNA invertase Pin-like site-specific DNA recombinase